MKDNHKKARIRTGIERNAPSAWANLSLRVHTTTPTICINSSSEIQTIAHALPRISFSVSFYCVRLVPLQLHAVPSLHLTPYKFPETLSRLCIVLRIYVLASLDSRTNIMIRLCMGMKWLNSEHMYVCVCVHDTQLTQHSSISNKNK